MAKKTFKDVQREINADPLRRAKADVIKAEIRAEQSEAELQRLRSGVQEEIDKLEELRPVAEHYGRIHTAISMQAIADRLKQLLEEGEA